MDPTTRCPVDIIKIIFEFAVATEITGFIYEELKTSFRTATVISHVSRRWREIALDTPRIWANIKASMGLPAEKLEPFWNRVHQRIKNVPVIVHLGSIQLSTINNLQICKLHEIPVIQRLHIYIDEPGFQCLLESIRGVRTAHIEVLALNFFGTGRPLITTELLNFIDPCTLQIGTESGFQIESGTQFPRIKCLRFATIRFLDFWSIFPSFPNLQVLHISHFLLYGYSDPTSITFPHLKELKIANKSRNYSTNWLKSITAPVLESFSIYKLQEPDLPFIKLHPSIKFLRWRTGNFLLDISRIAPQVRELVVGGKLNHFYEQILNGGPSPPFPFLETLSFQQIRKHGGINRENFDALIRTRCLPSSHPKSQLPPSIKPLKMLSIVIFNYDTPQEHIWAQNELCKEAEVEIFKRDKSLSFEGLFHDYADCYPRTFRVNLSWT